MFCFLDDIITTSKDSQEHFSILSQVLSRFESARLKVKLSKCAFLRKHVKFIGHKVDKHGIHTLDCKIQAIQSFPTPSSPHQIRQFLGLAGFYHLFIQDFSLIAQLLTQLFKKEAQFVWSEMHLLISKLLYVAL